MNGLSYLERQELINIFKRMFREPRRLLMWAPLIILVMRLVIPHPSGPLAPSTFELLLRGLSILLAVVLLARLGFPSGPLYVAEPADLVFILPAPLTAWQLMLRRHWVTLSMHFRALLGLIYVAAFILPVSFGQGLLILAFAMVYAICFDQVGLIAYRLCRARIPMPLLGRIAAVGYLIYAAWPLVHDRGSFTYLLGALRLGWLGDWVFRGLRLGSWTLLWVAVVLLLAAITLVSAPAIHDVDIHRVRLRALVRQARRGESSNVEVVRARAADRMQRRGKVELKTTFRFRGQGYIALAEAKMVMALRGLRSRWVPVLLAIVALGGGLLVSHFGSQGAVSALIFLSYISMFGLATGPLMMVHPLLVGAPRRPGLLWAEEIPTLVTWLGFYLLLWTVATVSGLDSQITLNGYAWIIAFQIVMAAWRLFLWSLFPETSLRYTVGRVVSILGGLVAAAIPLLGMLLPFPWGIPVTLAMAIAESWLINGMTLKRMTWAISHSRVAGQE